MIYGDLCLYLSQIEKKALLRQISPLVKQLTKYYCFSWNSITGCGCAGRNVTKHNDNNKKLTEETYKILDIVSNVIGKKVIRFPGTYCDFVICLSNKNNDTVLSLSPDGTEIIGERSYA